MLILLMNGLSLIFSCRLAHRITTIYLKDLGTSLLRVLKIFYISLLLHNKYVYIPGPSMNCDLEKTDDVLIISEIITDH